jgi:hypothetical protein
MSTVTPYRILTSYDPFILFEQELPRLRFNQRAPSPTAGQALVLVGGPEILVVRPGERVPNWLLGDYRYLYKMDVGEHPLALDCRLPARDGAFVFQAHLAYTAFVRDPATVATSRVRNVAAAVAPYLMQVMRNCSMDFDASDVGRAERKINAELVSAVGDSGIGVHRCIVQLTIDDDEGTGIREHRRTLMEISNRGMRFRQYEDFLRDGDTNLLTLHLAEHPEDAGALFNMLKDRESEESDRFLQTLRVVLNSSDGDEDFEIDEGRRRMVKSLFDKAAPDGMSPMRRISASRVRGTLAAGRASKDDGHDSRPEPKMVDGEARTTPEPGPDADSRHSRVRPMRDPDAE